MQAAVFSKMLVTLYHSIWHGMASHHRRYFSKINSLRKHNELCCVIILQLQALAFSGLDLASQPSQNTILSSKRCHSNHDVTSAVKSCIVRNHICDSIVKHLMKFQLQFLTAMRPMCSVAYFSRSWPSLVCMPITGNTNCTAQSFYCGLDIFNCFKYKGLYLYDPLHNSLILLLEVPGHP